VTIQSRAIPNLIQGVSQQAAQQRRDSQCEAQFDCINSPKDGAVARGGGDLIAMFAGANWDDAFFYEIFRGTNEHYLAVINGGLPQVYNVKTGAACSVMLQAPASASYFANTGSNLPRDSFTCQTVDDFTFIANKAVIPAMSSAVATLRPKEALIFFRATGYMVTFTVSVFWGGSQYRWTYITPDNSAASNAAFIGTSQIAATFFRAMSGASPSLGATTTGGVSEGDPGGSGSGNTSILTGPGSTLGSLGFSIEINGNLLRIWRGDGNDFQVETTDTVGDTYVRALKDNVRSFADLPQGGFPGMTFAVRPGAAEDGKSDYFVEYVNANPSRGYWRERAAPGVSTTIEPASMPHILVNTGVNTFEVRRATWSTRIAGDGVNSSKNPGFIGKAIEDLFYDRQRLGILTEATVDYSKARNVYTFFPDTVQTILADAPIGFTLSDSEKIALLRSALGADEGMFLWAQQAQFRVHSGNDPFRQDTVEAPPTSSYEFAESCNFAKVGRSVYFAAEPDDSVVIRNLQFQTGRIAGDIDVTDHVADYIPAGARRLSATDSGRFLFLQTDGEPSGLYLYNWLTSGNTQVQSAWNLWRFPEGRILWSSVYRQSLYMVLKRGDGVALLSVPLKSSEKDPGGDYLTRLDMRLTESQVTEAYFVESDTTKIVLPYAVPDSEYGLFRVKARASLSGGYSRGKMFDVVPRQVGDLINTIRVKTDVRAYSLYMGFRIESIRDESTFYVRGPDGMIPADDINVRSFICRHDKTSYYRIEVFQGARRSKVYELKNVSTGAASSAVGGPPDLLKGRLVAEVDMANEECSIRLVNDSPYPSRWQTAEYRFTATMRAIPSRTRQGEA
jgi:hypothetical protein